MIEPFSAACLAIIAQISGAVTIGSLAGGIAGNRADALFTKVVGGSVERFVGAIRLPPNHDLHKGIVAAQRKALDYVAETMTRQSRDARDGDIARRVQALVRQIDEHALVEQADGLKVALPAMVSRSDLSSHAAMLESATDAVAAWMERGIGEPLPAHFRALLHTATPDGRQSWLAVLRLLIAEKIKTDPRFGQIFLAENTSEILGRTVRIESLADEMLMGLDALRLELGTIGEDVLSVRSAQDEQLALQREQLALQQVQSVQTAELLEIARAGGAFGKAAEAGISETAVRRIVEQLGGEGIAKDDLVEFLADWIASTQKTLSQRSNEGAAFEAANARAAELFQAGHGAAAADPLMALLAQEQAETARRQIAILDQASLFDILARDFPAFTAKLAMIARLEGGDNAVWRAQTLHERGDHLAAKAEQEPVYRRAAVEAYETAIAQLEPDSPAIIAPLLRSNQGYQLYKLGVRTNVNTDLLRAIEVLEASVAGLPRDAHFESWATAQGNLAVAYNELAMRQQRPDLLVKAAEAREELITLFNPKTHPELWAANQLGLGSVYHAMFQMNQSGEFLEAALRCARAARDACDAETHPELWSKAQHNVALYQLGLAKSQRDAEGMDAGIETLRHLSAVSRDGHLKAAQGRIALNLSAALAEKAELFDDFDAYFEAIKVLQAVLPSLAEPDATMDRSMVLYNLAAVSCSLAKRVNSAHIAQQGHQALDDLEQMGDVQAVIASRLTALREGLDQIAQRAN